MRSGRMALKFNVTSPSSGTRLDKVKTKEGKTGNDVSED